MKMENLMKAFNYRISDGGEYLWKSWKNARSIDFQDLDHECYGGLVHNTETGDIYEATVYGGDDIGPYRWINPLFKKEYEVESDDRGVDPNIAWDNQKWIDLEEDDFLEKASAIFRGQDFDKRVTVPLDIDDNTILMLALQAHERDITINKMVEILLQEAIDKHVKSESNNIKHSEHWNLNESDDIDHSEHWYDTDRNR